MDGDKYHVTSEQVQFWKDNGYLYLPSVLSEEEISQVEPVYNKFIFGQVPDAAANTSDITGEEICLEVLVMKAVSFLSF